MKEAPSSFGWVVQQIALAVEIANHKPEEKEKPPMCPRCGSHPRVYSNGRLYSYCATCRKAVNKARYTSVKKRETR